MIGAEMNIWLIAASFLEPTQHGRRTRLPLRGGGRGCGDGGDDGGGALSSYCSLLQPNNVRSGGFITTITTTTTTSPPGPARNSRGDIKEAGARSPLLQGGHRTNQDQYVPPKIMYVSPPPPPSIL